MKHSIGRELLKLIQTEMHISILENYYSAYLNKKKDIKELDENYIDDHSLLYMSVQHLASYGEMDMNDLMEHHIGFNINIIKREKIFDILKDKALFLKNIRNATKSNIMEIIRQNGVTKFHGDAEHYFMGSRYSVLFEVESDTQLNRVIIKDIYVGEKHKRDVYHSNQYKPFIGLTI